MRVSRKKRNSPKRKVHRQGLSGNPQRRAEPVTEDVTTPFRRRE